MLGLTVWSIFRRCDAFDHIGWNGQHQRSTVVPFDIDLCPIAVRVDADHRACSPCGDWVGVVEFAQSGQGTLAR